jgi:hypothetical protein
MRYALTVSALAFALHPATASAQPASLLIHFDELADADLITNQYDGVGVRFSGPGGFIVWVNGGAAAIAASKPNSICVGPGPAEDGLFCGGDTFVDFASPVNGLSFSVVGSNSAGTVAQVRVFDALLALIGTVNVVGSGVRLDPPPVLVDLGAFQDVRRIEIVNDADLAGLGYDDFRLTPSPPSTSVPEPSTAALLAGGIAAVAGLAGARGARGRPRTRAH